MKTITIVVLGVAAVGCASTPVPADKYARATAAVRSAEVMNAQELPNASLHLRLAREQLATAKNMLQNGENERAAYVLLRAEADANAAMSIAKEAWAKQEARETIENVRQLKSRLEVPQS